MLLRSVLLLLVFACAAGCGDDRPTTKAPIERLAPGESIRLIDRLYSARVTSPLSTTTAVDSVLSFGASLQGTPVFGENFQQLTMERYGWPELPTTSLVTGERGAEDKALQLTGAIDLALRAKGDRLRNAYNITLPADPQTFYLIHRAIATRNPGYIDLRVYETLNAVKHPEVINHPEDRQRPGLLGLDDAGATLMLHQFPPASGKGGWEHHTVLVRTTPETRSLVIGFVPLDAHDTAPQQVAFDDVSVTKLTLTREQELALLKPRELAEGQDKELGIAKYGRLLPLGRVSAVAPPHDDNAMVCSSLFAPAPTSITYDLDIPEAARLEFRYGMLDWSRPGDSATFKVSIESEGEPEVVFSRALSVDPEHREWYWNAARIELDRFAGQRVKLTLETADGPSKQGGYAVWCNPEIAVPRADREPPNVLLIGIDTLRADRLSGYGYARKTSPHLDALGRDGVTFLNATSPANSTLPGFGSIFTGLVPSRHGVTDLPSIARLAPEHVTLAELMRAGGWRTHAILYKPTLFDAGFEQGFDTSFNLPKDLFQADDNLRKALAWLGENHDRRFFLFLHLDDPHLPVSMPKPYDRMFTRLDMDKFQLKIPFDIEGGNEAFNISPDGEELPCGGCGNGTAAFEAVKPVIRDLYDGEIAYLDSRLGILFDTLKAQGLYDNTIIAIVSDHGELLWDFEGHYDHARYLFEGLTHVPLIVKPATKNRPWTRGAKVATHVRSFDLMPTILDLVGLDHAKLAMNAESLAPLIKSGDGQRPADRVAYAEDRLFSGISIQSDHWKYIRELAVRRFGVDAAHRNVMVERLYDMKQDPREMRNLASTQVDKLRELRLATVDYVLGERPGFYLVLSGAPTARITATLKASGQPLAMSIEYGPRHPISEGGATVFEGTADGALYLFIRLDAIPTDGLVVEMRAGEGQAKLTRSLEPADFVSYTRGALTGILRPELGIHVFSGPPAIGSSRAGQPGLRADHLEALKAMGYIK